MQLKNNSEHVSVAPQKSRLHQVTPLSKYLAMVLFIILPFVGGWIGYMYAPEKAAEVQNSNDIISDSAVSLEKVDEPSVSDTKDDFEFSLLTYTIERKTLEDEIEWINVYDNANLSYSFIIGEVVNGEWCYLGLCDTPSEEELVTNNNVVWKKIDTKDCVGGCNAVSSLYRVTIKNENHYFIIWEDSDREKGIALLKSFTWK
jgi:hypothetical protein